MITISAIIQELERLPLKDRLFVIEKTLRTNRINKEKNLKEAVSILYKDYRADKELTIFTEIDNMPF